MKVKLASIIAGVVIGGIGYWFQPYNQLNVFGIHTYIIWFVGAFLISMLLMFLFKCKKLTLSSFMALGILLAVTLRILFDIAFLDPTSHNLFPFEIIICGIVSFPGALAGAFFPGLFKR